MEKIEEWKASVGRWKEGRVKLNKVIRRYNKWVDTGEKAEKLLRVINKNLDMPYCNQSNCWREELMGMKENILNKI